MASEQQPRGELKAVAFGSHFPLILTEHFGAWQVPDAVQNKPLLQQPCGFASAVLPFEHGWLTATEHTGSMHFPVAHTNPPTNIAS
jgi:hypothetical protein